MVTKWKYKENNGKPYGDISIRIKLRTVSIYGQL